MCCKISICEKIKQFFKELSIKDACQSTCCIKEVIHNETIIIKQHDDINLNEINLTLEK